MESKFTWVEFYIELADKILTFKGNRAALVEKVREAHKTAGKELPKVESDNNNIPDIDPFTVFALFNRGKQGVDARMALCSGYKSAFGISAAVPTDFDGIPMFNYNQYCFYRYVSDPKRNENCFDVLWNLFDAAIKYADDKSNETEFKENFEKALLLDLVGLPKLTIGLFQIRPNTFVNLDSVNKSLIESRTNTAIDVHSGDDYIKTCAKVFEHINASTDCNTLPEFSSLAFDKKTNDKSADKDEWFPSLEEYDPGISKEQWIDFMKNSGLFNDNYKDFLTKMLNMGGQATCAQLADKYGNTVAHYNMTVTHLAEHVVEYTHCVLRKDDEGKDRYWTVLFVGKNASAEEKGGFIWKLRTELKEALEAMNLGKVEEKELMETQPSISKNMILYGPPGTGKTYNTVIYAVAIIENADLNTIKGEPYEDVIARYNNYKSEGLVEFTTFHQSYGYEDFIEGIKPVMDDENEENKDIEYEISSGLFKTFCERASQPIIKKEKKDIGLNASPSIWKVSLEGTYDNPTRTECLENNHIRVGYDSYGENITGETDFSEHGGKNVLNAFIYKMKIGDIVLSCYSSTTIDAIGVVTGEYEWHDEYEHYKRLRTVNWIVKNIREDITEANGSTMTLPSVYRMNISLGDVMAIIGKHSKNTSDVQANENKYVFVIDEINRGNISKIFGELITLIEPSKRIGQVEGASAKLPYSKKPFGVPDNVYLIGTMNTADRSIATIDTALRRRFQFKEMQPNPEVLEGINVDGISIKDMLTRMNKKISVLFDREHTIGHAYFMPLKKDNSLDALAVIFENNIIPLLQEYFYDDYEKIRLVLGDNRKANESEQFVVAKATDYSELFGDTDLDSDDAFSYEINKQAFGNIEAYKYI